MTSNVVISDGGRIEAGFRGKTRDCVIRALAIATGVPYIDCYNLIAAINAQAGLPKSARNGSARKNYRVVFDELFDWEPLVTIGSGIKVHLREDDLPPGRLIARCSKHLVAVIDGVIHDSHDSTRNGTRGVYGVWHLTKPTEWYASEIKRWTTNLLIEASDND